MPDPNAIYDLLIDRVPQDAIVDEVLIGLTWTLCRSAQGTGLAMGPGIPSRTLEWAGTLSGRRVREIADWLRAWQPHEAAVAMAAINADNALAASAVPLASDGPANLAVFEHFRDPLRGRRVVVIGRYPGLENLEDEVELQVLERQPAARDLPDPAAEYVVPGADWVFLTASSLTNKTFPRLAELAADSTLVLMGPTVPWLEELREFGVDYLAGVEILDHEVLRRIVGEGGGTRIFGNGVGYAVVDLHADELTRLRDAIAAVVRRRDALKAEMDAWYSEGKRRYPGAAVLATIDARLSILDTRFKRLWDSFTPDAISPES